MSGDSAIKRLTRTGTGLSDVGRKRTSNEDAYFFDDRLGLYIVGDGMGGHAAGEIASQEAVETVYGMVKRGISTLHELAHPPVEEDVRAACRLMESSIQAATYMVYSMAELDRQKSGMGTTLSSLLVLGEYAVTAIQDAFGHRVDQVERRHVDDALPALLDQSAAVVSVPDEAPHQRRAVA